MTGTRRGYLDSPKWDFRAELAIPLPLYSEEERSWINSLSKGRDGCVEEDVDVVAAAWAEDSPT